MDKGPAEESVSPFKEAGRDGVQLLSNGNFWSAVVGNFAHICRSFANDNFLNIFTEALISPTGFLALCSVELSLFYQACKTVPKVPTPT